jgi:GGDEF domain-containing protein
MMPPSAFHTGRLSIGESLTATSSDDFVVRVETSLLDVALQMARSPYRQLLVQTPEGEIAGVVSDSDLLSFLARTDVDESGSWKTRGVESVMPVRLRRVSETPLSTGEPRVGVKVTTGSSHDCVPIVVNGRLIAVQTHDDLLLSWSQLQPLVQSATTDELTALANRSVFQRRLSEEWNRSTRYGEPLALLLIDLDGFKAVNDSLGHLAGDAVLAEFGACLRRTLRLYDVVARFGGDEFAALCCNCNPSDIAAPIQRSPFRSVPPS